MFVCDGRSANTHKHYALSSNPLSKLYVWGNLLVRSALYVFVSVPICTCYSGKSNKDLQSCSAAVIHLSNTRWANFELNIPHWFDSAPDPGWIRVKVCCFRTMIHVLPSISVKDCRLHPSPFSALHPSLLVPNVLLLSMVFHIFSPASNFLLLPALFTLSLRVPNFQCLLISILSAMSIIFQFPLSYRDQFLTFDIKKTSSLM